MVCTIFTLTQSSRDGAWTHKSCLWKTLGGGVSLTLARSLCFDSCCILDWFRATFASEEKSLWSKLQKWTIQQRTLCEKPMQWNNTVDFFPPRWSHHLERKKKNKIKKKRLKEIRISRLYCSASASPPRHVSFSKWNLPSRNILADTGHPQVGTHAGSNHTQTTWQKGALLKTRSPFATLWFHSKHCLTHKHTRKTPIHSHYKCNVKKRVIQRKTPLLFVSGTQTVKLK